MLSNKYKLASRRKHDLISEIGSIFYAARKHKYTHEETLNWIAARVYQSENYKKIPQYMHQYLDGYIESNWNRIQNEEIEQKIYWQGEFLSTKDPKLSGHWKDINDFPDEQKPHIYWIGTEKRYY
jgi:uncharacterized protein YlbG (UPF0298 family)